MELLFNRYTLPTIDWQTLNRIRDKFIYKGMPLFSDDFNLYTDNFPLSACLLEKIGCINLNQTFTGKQKNNGVVVQDAHRKYAFSHFINGQPSLFYLFIKNKEKHFNHQQEFGYILNNQIIPITYQTLSNMSEEELGIIWEDFD